MNICASRRLASAEFRVQSAKWILLVGPSGLEPPTSCLSGTRSNLLSYEPMWLVKWFCSHLVFLNDVCLNRVKDSLPVGTGWWRWWDSNPWPPACRAGALPAELHPHNRVCLLLRFFQVWERFYPFPFLCWHWAIFPGRFQPSIFATAELNFCVRNGYRWTLCVCNTNFFFSNS